MQKEDVLKHFDERIKNNINDALYVEGLSWEGRLKVLRTYVEIILRFILCDEACCLTLGNKMIKSRLRDLSPASDFLLNAVDRINALGNDNIHTYKSGTATEQDFNNALDAVYDLYAFLFIDYFLKYGVATNNKVLEIFSLLPPVIRKKTFSYLWEKDKENIVVVDKLCLAILKSDGVAAARDWVDTNEALLKQLSCRTRDFENDFVQKVGENIASYIFDLGVKNMYEVCLDKINQLSTVIENQGVLYATYEEALRFYEKKMSGLYMSHASEEEFVTLMDFCFKGRKSIDNGKNQLVYSVGNIIGVI